MKFNFIKKTFEVYCVFDPAIDQDKSNIAEYVKTRDVKHLVFKPDIKPTKFLIKNIPRGIYMNLVINQANNRHSFLGFQYAIDSIENLKPCFLTDEVEMDSKSVLPIWEPTERIQIGDGSTFKYISDDDMNRAFNLATVWEIGGVALKKMLWIPGTELEYQVPPTSTELIGKVKTI